MFSAILAGLFTYRATKSVLTKDLASTEGATVVARRVGLGTTAGVLSVEVAKRAAREKDLVRKAQSFAYEAAGTLIGSGYRVMMMGCALAGGLLTANLIWALAVNSSSEPIVIRAAGTA